MSPDSRILEDITARIVACVRPLRIILFGSAAKDDMGPHSDLDLLVVMPNGTHRRDASRRIYCAIARCGIAKDIIVVTENDIIRYREDPSLIIKPALDNGRELYKI